MRFRRRGGMPSRRGAVIVGQHHSGDTDTPRATTPPTGRGRHDIAAEII
jgi:hypothetical protein